MYQYEWVFDDNIFEVRTEKVPVDFRDCLAEDYKRLGRNYEIYASDFFYQRAYFCLHNDQNLTFYTGSPNSKNFIIELLPCEGAHCLEGDDLAEQLSKLRI